MKAVLLFLVAARTMAAKVPRSHPSRSLGRQLAYGYRTHNRNSDYNSQHAMHGGSQCGPAKTCDECTHKSRADDECIWCVDKALTNNGYCGRGGKDRHDEFCDTGSDTIRFGEARQAFAEHFFRSNALHCTATARSLIPAECSAIP